MKFLGKQYFIASTGTDIGKTYCVTKFCADFTNSNIAVDAIKPIASGFDGLSDQSDSALILRSLGKEINEKNIADITPWRFKAALSPSIAAPLEGAAIDFQELTQFCQKKISAARQKNQFLFIEGAGGVMTPINAAYNFLDLMKNLQIPVLLVAGNYLGSISHTLSALLALKASGVIVEKIIINDFYNKNPHVKIDDTINEIKNFCDIEIDTIN